MMNFILKIVELMIFTVFWKKKKIIFSESEIVEDIIQDNIVDGGNFDFDIKNQFIDFFKKFK